MDNFDSIYFSRFAIDPDSVVAGIDLAADFSLPDDLFFEISDDEICSYDSDDADSFLSM